MPRRTFLRQSGTALFGAAFVLRVGCGAGRSSVVEDEETLARIAAHRPSRLAELPPDFNGRVGSAHVAGRYCLTEEPFLLEGARRLLAMGARLGKFWFMPANPGGSYPFHSRWGRYQSFVELAESEHFRALFALPFQTLFLEAHSPVEQGWRQADRDAAFHAAVTREFHDLTAHLYRVFRDRPVTVVLQHWEGDWLLRGAGEKWNPPPADWKQRCDRMVRWLAARQAGVTAARQTAGKDARCIIAHAAEVNRVADAWRGIPTMTEHVLPRVELDLVSYSAYDGLASPVKLWRCIETIRRYARTGALFGQEAVSLGEFGIPENDQPERIAERLDGWLGVVLAAKVRHAVYWQLYCNEFARDLDKKPKPPVTDPRQLRGFWLVKPDGSLSAAGRYFREQWSRATG